MTDSITISGIHPEVRQISVVLNIEGATYPKNIPMFDTQDAAVLSAQLQAFAQELRGEFDALRASVQAADAAGNPAVSDAVNALVGTSIPVDVPAPAPAPAVSSDTPPTS